MLLMGQGLPNCISAYQDQHNNYMDNQPGHCMYEIIICKAHEERRTQMFLHFSQQGHTGVMYCTCGVKGTVSRDFRRSVFFINNFFLFLGNFINIVKTQN
jgi:hypothetical protein